MNSMSGHSGGGSRDAFDTDDDDDDDETLDEDIADPGAGSNRFFRPRNGADKGAGRVFAAVEVPEPNDDVARSSLDESEESVSLECIDADWFWQAQRSGKSWIDLYGEVPLSVLELQSYPLPEFPPGAQPGDIAWFEFGYEYSSLVESDARVYTSLYSQGAPARITFHEPRGKDWAGEGPMGNRGWLAGHMNSTLNRTVSNDPPSFLRRLGRVKRSAGVAVYDVGQGNCQALLDEHLHIPLLYVDFGGGVLFNSNTFPKSLRGFCFTERPPIVLSHWDWDHWSSAYRYPIALSQEWIAPPVPETPIQQAFAADLYAKGHLSIWDNGWPSELRAGGVRIERCTGRTSNDSGLAVTFNSGAIGRRSCLLPGDAAYRFVPSVAAAERFNALCMSHHGGRLHSKHYPLPKRNAVAVNSAGPRNSYKHPMLATLASHFEAGWPMPVVTGTSGQRPCHVFLPWGKKPHLFHGGCHGDVCGVAIARTVPHCASVTMPAKPAPTTSKGKAAKASVSA